MEAIALVEIVLYRANIILDSANAGMYIIGYVETK